MHRPLDPELLSHLKAEFGSHGHRAVEFLFTAWEILSWIEQSPDDVPPRVAETVAYCLREAMTEIPQSQNARGSSWSNVSREVVDAKRRYEQAERYPGMDAEGALAALLRKIDEMAKIHDQKQIHERRLLARYMVERDAVALIGRSAHLADTDEYRKTKDCPCSSAA